MTFDDFLRVRKLANRYWPEKIIRQTDRYFVDFAGREGAKDFTRMKLRTANYVVPVEGSPDSYKISEEEITPELIVYDRTASSANARESKYDIIKFPMTAIMPLLRHMATEISVYKIRIAVVFKLSGGLEGSEVRIHVDCISLYGNTPDGSPMIQAQSRPNGSHVCFPLANGAVVDERKQLWDWNMSGTDRFPVSMADIGSKALSSEDFCGPVFYCAEIEGVLNPSQVNNPAICAEMKQYVEALRDELGLRIDCLEPRSYREILIDQLSMLSE